MHEVFHHLADRLGMTGTQDMVNNLDPVFAASYEPAALPGEAFAEFGWRYMESETLARQFAGDAFVDQFEARLRQAGMQKTIHNAARQLRIWLNATVNDRIGATIVDKNKATKPGSIRAQLRAMISQHIDDTAAAEPVNASILGKPVYSQLLVQGQPVPNRQSDQTQLQNAFEKGVEEGKKPGYAFGYDTAKKNIKEPVDKVQ